MPRFPEFPFVGPPRHYGSYVTNKSGIAIHATANDAPAINEANWAKQRPDTTSSHFYVDRTSGIQSLDTAMVAWHAGSEQGNENAVSIEITGVNAWTRAQWLANVDWQKLTRLCAWICRTHNIAARHLSVLEMRAGARGIYTHDDMRRAWGGTDHTDPGPNFPMDHLVAQVAAQLGGGTQEEDMSFQNGIVAQGDAATIILTPPVQRNGWGAGAVSFGTDFGDTKLRVAIHNGVTWSDIRVLDVFHAKGRPWIALPPGCEKISVVRVDGKDTPCGWLVELGRG